MRHISRPSLNKTCKALGVIAAVLAATAPADARRLTLRLAPGVLASELSASDPVPSTLAQNTPSKSGANPADRADPLSDRAKAAADRAARALAEEEGREYDGAATTSSDLVDTADEAIPAAGPAKEQPLTPSSVRQKSATSQTSCVAGC